MYFQVWWKSTSPPVGLTPKSLQMSRLDPANQEDNLNGEQDLQNNRISSTKYEEIKNSCENGTKKTKTRQQKSK